MSNSVELSYLFSEIVIHFACFLVEVRRGGQRQEKRNSGSGNEAISSDQHWFDQVATDQSFEASHSGNGQRRDRQRRNRCKCYMSSLCCVTNKNRKKRCVTTRRVTVC